MSKVVVDSFAKEATGGNGAAGATDADGVRALSGEFKFLPIAASPKADEVPERLGGREAFKRIADSFGAPGD